MLTVVLFVEDVSTLVFHRRISCLPKRVIVVSKITTQWRFGTLDMSPMNFILQSIDKKLKIITKFMEFGSNGA